jgi:hypothetical protein
MLTRINVLGVGLDAEYLNRPSRRMQAMTIPADVHETVSRELSVVIEAVIDNYEAQARAPPTLGSVRAAMVGGFLDRLVAESRIRSDTEAGFFSEVDRLIERYGDEALAVRFQRPRASEDLSTVIEAAMDVADADQPPTLAVVRDAMQGGLVAQLVGHGQLDSDDEQTLFEEIDALIVKHGEEALAEELLRYY